MTCSRVVLIFPALCNHYFFDYVAILFLCLYNITFFHIKFYDAGASINTPNIGNSALIIKELDLGGQDALNTCENSFFGPHLGLERQKNVVKLGQTLDMEPPY